MSEDQRDGGQTNVPPVGTGQGTGEPTDPNAGGEPAKPTLPSDDTEIEVDGAKMTIAELKGGYMRQSDYSRKTQELARDRDEFEKSKQPAPSSSEDEYPEEDVKAAEYLTKIARKRFGLLTREEYNREREAEQFGQTLNSTINKWNKTAELPKVSDMELIDFMKWSNIHNPDVAIREMHKDAWLNHEITMRQKGKKGYSAEKTGQRVEPKPKSYDFKSDQGMRDYLQDEITKAKE
jgi:hypothetical protein